MSPTRLFAAALLAASGCAVPALVAAQPATRTLQSPSGDYLNLAPRRRPPARPFVPALPQASESHRVDTRRTVCGLTVLGGSTYVDPGIVAPRPTVGPAPTIRTVDPPLCGPQPEAGRR